MGIFDDIGDFLLGWLVPETEKAEAGTELTTASTEAYIQKVVGKVKKQAGTIIFKATNDIKSDDYPNDLLHIIVVWAEAVESIDEVYIDDMPYSINSSAFFKSDGSRSVYVLNFPNGMDGYSDPHLTAAGWRSTDKCSGKACTYIRLEYHDGENAITSEPDLSANLTGTSYDNPPTFLYDFLTDHIVGKGLSDDYIDLAAVATCETICDVQVETYTGSGEYRKLFTCNVALDTSNTVLDNTNTLLKSFRAMMPILNGKLTPIIEKDDPPVDILITKDDILELGSISNSSKLNRYNQVTVEYYDDSDGEGTLQSAVWPTPDSTTDLTMLAEDHGFRMDKKVKRETCRDYYEALEEAKSICLVSREQLNTTIKIPKWGTVFEVGDIVPVQHPFPRWTEDKYPTYGGKLFRITKTKEDRDSATLSLREHQPYVYDIFGEGNKPSYPDTGLDTTGPDVPTGLTVTPYYDTFKQVRVSWASTAQRFQYQVISSTDELLIADSETNKYADIKGMELGTYRFRVRAVGGFGLVSGWAEIPIAMEVPGVPDSITVNATNWELEVIPSLTGSNSYTQFQFAISDTEATEPPTPYRGPAHAYTFPGRSANTTYRIWVRSYNELGHSPWIYTDETTTNDSAAILEILDTSDWGTFRTEITQAIENITSDVSLWSEETSELGTNYSTLLYNVSQSLSASQANHLEILAVKEQIGDDSVNAQVVEYFNVQIGYEDETTGEWVAGPLAEQLFQTNVSTVDGNSMTVTAYLQALENAAGGLEGQFRLVIDGNGRLTGIFGTDDGVTSDVNIAAENFNVVHSDGRVSLKINTVTNELEFFGSGEFSGTLKSAKSITIGSDFMKIEDPDGFGADDLWYWYGPKMVDGFGDPDYASLTKDNAYEWKDLLGNGGMVGSFLEGQLLRQKYATSTTTSVTAAGHVSKGNPVTIQCQIAFRVQYSTPDRLTGEPTELDYWIKRGSVIIKTGSIPCIRYEVDPGGEPGVNWLTKDRCVLSPMFVDTTNSAGTYDYTLEVYDWSPAGTTTYGLEIMTSENLIG